MNSTRLGDYPALQTFLATEIAATLALPIDAVGTPYAAALLYSHSEDPLEFYFVTGQDTEKCQWLIKQRQVPAAVVIGTVRGTPLTLQMRGTLAIADVTEYADALKAYYHKRGNHHDDINNPANVLLAFRPSWARFTDYAEGRKRYTLIL